MDSGDPGYVNRILVATPCVRSLSVEWVQARYGMLVPVNWSQVTMYSYMEVPSMLTTRYQVDDAQNAITKIAIEKDFQWLLLHEHDNIPEPDALMRLNKYMREASHPVVSGLYFTKSEPCEPLIFRGRGLGAFYDWKMGEKVYCDGVPTGFLLVHVGILKAMWDESEEYEIRGHRLRRVFNTPRNLWFDPESGFYNTITGTSDLEWCSRVISGNYLQKAGWKDYVDNLPDPRYPFLVDTSIFLFHQDPMTGQMYPPAKPAMIVSEDNLRSAEKEEAPPTLGVNVGEDINSAEIIG